MGSFLDKPKTEKSNERGQGNDLHYGLAAMQGWRIEMEDSHTSIIGIPHKGLESWSFFAVFDGHAGGLVSKLSSKDLLDCILKADEDLFKDLSSEYSNYISNSTNNNQNNNKISSNNYNNNNSNLNSSSSNSSNNLSNSPSRTTNNNHLSTSSSSPDNNSNSNSNLTNSNINKNNGSNSNSSNNINSSDLDTNNFRKENDTATTTTNSNTNIKNQLTDTSSSSLSSSSNTNISSSNTKLKNTNSNSNSNYFKLDKSYEDRLKLAIRQGFLDLDNKLRRMPEFDRGEEKSGSTAIACLISPSHVFLINCGDSRAILVSDDKVVLATEDHKPINPNERERIQNAGGSVMIQRVNGSLAVSRALGDFEYKCVENRNQCEQLVSPEPEIYAYERNEDKDEFVVLACDGIWDVMTNEELKKYVHSRLKVTNDLVKISNEILDMCLNKGSRDNMSLIIVSFPGAPSVTQEEVEKDNSCNEKIENKVKELIANSSSKIDLSQILHSISEENLEHLLPPGGGIHAKQALIEEIFNRLSPQNNEEDSTNFLLNHS